MKKKFYLQGGGIILKLKMSLEYWKRGISQQYKKIPLSIKTVFWFTVCVFLQKAVGMLMTPVYTRIMSAEEYGEYSVFISVTSLLAVVTTFNITSILATKGMSKYSTDRERFLTNIQLLSSIGVLISTVFFLCNKEWFCQLTGLNIKTMYFVLAQMFVMPAFEIWSAKQRYDFNYKKILFFTIIYLSFNVIFVTFAVIISENKGEARIISSSFVLILMYGLLYFSNLKLKRGVISKEMLIFSIKFNLPLIPQGLANQVLARSDILMIQYYQGTGQSGIYSLGYSIASIIIMLTTSINNVYVPWFYKKLDKKEYEDIKEKSIYMLEVVFFAVTMMILVSPEIVCLFAPREYEDAAYVIAPVAVGIAFTIVDTLFVYIELYFEKTMLVMFGSICVAIMNILLNVCFIPRYGFVAAAYTTLVSYIGYTMVHFLCVTVFCKSKINIFEIYNIKKVMTMCIVQIMILLIIVVIYPYRILRYLFGIIGCIFGVIIVMKRRRNTNVG